MGHSIGFGSTYTKNDLPVKRGVESRPSSCRMRRRMSDVCGTSLWRFWRDWPRCAELLSWVTRLLLDVSWLVCQGSCFHADSARAGDLLRWSALGCWRCCFLVARSWSGHRGNWCSGKLGKRDFLTLLGSGASCWFGHRVLSLGVCDSLSLLGGCTLYWRGCWSRVVWDWSGRGNLLCRRARP